MKRSDVILALAPSFRDKFDFSTPDQYQKWFEMVEAAAEPFVKLMADEEISHRTTAARERVLDIKVSRIEAELAYLKEATK